MEDYKGISDSSAVVEALARMLCGDTDTPPESAPVTTLKIKRANAERETVIVDSMFSFGKMKPCRAFTCDPLDDSRLYSQDYRDLLVPPDEVIGGQTEVIVMDGDVAKWIGFRKTNKLPRGLCTMTKCRSLYEVHFRLLTGAGCSDYVRAMVGVSMSGKPTPVLVPNARKSGSGPTETQILTLAASVIEDSNRANSVIAEFSDGATIVMPVGLEDYQELFSLREAPLTPSGRRRAILHWVATHKRRKPNRVVTVKEHLRGVQEFTVDGLRVRLTPNARA